MKVMIAGAGKLGLSVAEALLGGGNEITLLDTNEALIQKVNNRLDIFTMVADAQKIDVLNKLRIRDYDLVIACADRDEKNILIAKFAKELGCKQTIARVRSPEYVEQLDFVKKTMGIDHIVNPDLACATQIYKHLTKKYTLHNGRATSGGITIIETPITTLPALIDKKVRETADIIKGLLITAVSRDGKILVPTGNTDLREGDMIYLLGLDETVNRINTKIKSNDSHTGVKRVMIAGGGTTGFYLAQKLVSFGASTKIIETNRDRCEYLSARLGDALILNGDATDTNLLHEENLDSMDAFVACTGFDEENLLLSLIAKQHGVPDVVTKVSRKSYAPLTEQLGVSMIINPLDLCSSSILRFVQKNDVVLFSQMVQGQAEFIEILADSSMPLTEKTLKDLDVPEGVLISAIHRKGEIIIPSGATRVQAGDRVMIFTLLSSVPNLEGMIKKGRTNLF